MRITEINEELLTDEQRKQLVFPGFAYSGESAKTGIVLGTSVGASVRAKGAAQLYLAGKVNKLIPSGQPEWDFPEGHFSEAEYMKYLLVSEGVTDSDVICENQATTTYENMTYSRKIIEAAPQLLPDGKLLLITSGYHMYRSLLLAQHVFPEVRIIPCPFWEENVRAENWTQSDFGRRRVLGEVHFLIHHARNGIIRDEDVDL